MSKARMLDAVNQLDVDAVRDLLAARPDLLNVTDRRGFNLLLLACAVPCADRKIPESRSAAMVNLLLDRGLDVESMLPPEHDRCTALFFAVARGRNATLIKLLLKRGAKVQNAPGGGLFAAAWYDDVGHLDLLVKAGANIHVVVGVTPFLAAWMWKKFEAARFLARKGADVNFADPKSGRTALRYGVEKEFDPAQLAWLVSHGASPDIKDKLGVSARDRASRKRDKRWVAALA
ncbi:MAG TPA: ankyrin repeat domain-containing protein [Vicinamibacterales bacterium]|nr:ankyrin repeat domain-containing protein [Vicinamibacterales bacterium]